MRSALTSLAALALATLSTAAPALSIVAAKEHDRSRACAAVERVLAGIAGKRDDWITPFFTTDRLGYVEYAEQTAFIEAMTTSEGRPDKQPLKLARLYRISDDKFSPLYVAAIDRLVWHDYREEDDGNGGSKRIHDPRHYSESGYWLIEFQSDQVIGMREAFEVYQLADDDDRVNGCG